MWMRIEDRGPGSPEMWAQEGRVQLCGRGWQGWDSCALGGGEDRAAVPSERIHRGQGGGALGAVRTGWWCPQREFSEDGTAVPSEGGW